MGPTPQDDFFEPYESQYVTDLSGRLLRYDAPTRGDLTTRVVVSIDGEDVREVPLAVPATDAQGNVLHDKDGHVVPRRTTVYDAVSWRYRGQGRNFPGPDPDNPVPVLCHQNHLRPAGVCRVCSVLTVKNGRPGEKLIPACQHPLVPDRDLSKPCMEVHTVASAVEIQAPGQREKVPAGRYLLDQVNVLVEMLAANSLHEERQGEDRRYHNELLALRGRFREMAAAKPGRELKLRRRELKTTAGWVDDSSDIIRVDHNNCILCDRCVRGCSEVKPFRIIGHTGFGHQARISFDLGRPMGESECVKCGECAVSCPTGALTFKGSIYFDPQRKEERDPWKEEPVRPETVPATELADDPLFTGVPFAFLRWNQGAVGRVKTRRGMELCRQDDYGSTAFLPRKGTIEVVIDGEVRAKRSPADVIVGELACLSHQPRSATLRAADDGEVWVVKRNMLQALQRNRAAREVLGPIYRKRSLANFLQRDRPFLGLPYELSERCVEYLQRRPELRFVLVGPGQAIFLQGQVADALYIVYRGFVSVSETNAYGKTTIRDYMGPERQFGEVGLLSDPGVSARVAEAVEPGLRGRRTGNCAALDHVELVVVPREAFLGLLNAEPAVRKALEDRALGIVEKNRRAREEVSPLLQKHAEAGLYQGQNLLVLELNRCTRCQECVKACADSHGGVTRLVLEGNRFGEYLVPSACRSCHDPECLTGCPVDAIHRRPAKPGSRSLAIFIEDHCIGCGLCAHNCPFGSIHMHARADGRRRAGEPGRVATNCDLCESLDGSPRCVYHCPHDAAVRMTGQQLARRVGLSPLGLVQDGGR